jgi:hypothetical protein
MNMEKLLIKVYSMGLSANQSNQLFPITYGLTNKSISKAHWVEEQRVITTASSVYQTTNMGTNG